MKTNKRLFMVAALLATSTAVELDATGTDALNIRADFEQQPAGDLVTTNSYRIQIDRIAIPSGDVDVRPRHQDDLDRILAQLERPTIDITPGYEVEPEETSLVLTNARFEGRVFDNTNDARLPAEGLGISGEVPLNVRVVRTGDATRPLDVRFEVPTRYFDGVDWGWSAADEIA